MLFVLGSSIDKILLVLPECTRQGKIHGGRILGRGQERSVSPSAWVAERRHFAPLIRDCRSRLAFGGNISTPSQHLGDAGVPMRAARRQCHRGRPKEGMLPMISHLGAIDFCGQRRLAGDGVSVVKRKPFGQRASEMVQLHRSCHEALNQAAMKVAADFGHEPNNQYAYDSQ